MAVVNSTEILAAVTGVEGNFKFGILAESRDGNRAKNKKENRFDFVW